MTDLMHPIALSLAIIADATLGDPAWAYRRVPHPIVLIGQVIAWADRRFNRESAGAAARRRAGLAVCIALTLGALLLGWIGQALLLKLPGGPLWLGLVMSTLIAQKSLYAHVADVAKAMELSGVDGGRIAVARIVGRDPEALDEAGIARAAVESLAENFSDGIVAPIFWGLVLGLPGMLAYKTINTMDSMIGHKTPRHLDFGRAAARLDDLVNLPASRLSALLLILASLVQRGARAAAAWRAVWRDATRHKSPNAGWPEAAMAGALGLAIAGPRRYHGVLVSDPWMNDGGRWQLKAADIRTCLALYWRACAVLGLVVLGCAAL
ncbi:adenosylcobinamide-phosphate synthase CbiB [Dongia rigui]|uniref:Cobalamin biosynthesis protein CobD n=1 Tax=Dongia rigui TaxID=940149 RepID=A0ABU5DYT1_9PROT|nr:adenosylcobinamide-phosphate synthase CbiB [Dongia rigui]MDY0872430.1 adenosylcobinamide-phosphate synthase CbiB [Dongia rigui]